MRHLTTFVHVQDADGVNHAFGPTDDVPAWATKLITNPKAWSGSAPTPEPPKTHTAKVTPIPPKGGPKATVAAWTAYAATFGLPVAEDASRKDIIDALDAAGVPTE